MTNLRDSALETIGKIPPRRPTHYTDDLEISNMSKERKLLRIKRDQMKEPHDRSVIISIINYLKRCIKKRLKAITNAKADALVDQINNQDSTKQMYEAVRNLAANREKSALCVHDKDGNIVGTDELKAAVIKDYFEEQFNDANEEDLSPFIDPPGPLDCPISIDEVTKAVARLKSGRASGPDDIPNELLKSAGPYFCKTYTRIINQSFESNKFIPCIGEGLLTPLPKPGKPKGPVKSIRPLTLLNGARKILSLITLWRINNQLDMYTGPWQAGYKQHRGCADLVWAQRMLIAVVLKKDFEYHKVNIDMTAAFNTIRRGTTIRLLDDAGCSRDDIRLVQYLLSNTRLTVRVNTSLSTQFNCNLGAFQGDSLSGKLFTLNLAGGLYHIRAVCSDIRPNPPISHLNMPMESEYSDDAEFLDTSKSNIEAIFTISTKILEEWSLFVNDKSVFTKVYLAEPHEKDEHNKKVRGNEEWRKEVLLGSKLCATEDITTRINKANSAFFQYKRIWCQGSKISESRKIRLYESLVISVLLYNCSSWAAPADVMEKLNVMQRKHLRKLLNIYWPAVISNEALYKRCNVRPITKRVEASRWKMLGHILRSGNMTPAFQSFQFACIGSRIYKGRLGRPRTNLYDCVVKDLAMRHLYVNSIDEFYNLVYIASDRKRWRELFNETTG